MKKRRIGRNKRDNIRYISSGDKKRSLIIYTLIVSLMIFLLITIIVMILKINNKDNNVETDEVKVNNTIEDKKTKDSNSTEEVIERDANKVVITVDTSSLTENGAVINISDSNDIPYKWTPFYKLQKQIDGEWEDIELKNPENAIFPDIEYDNTTGSMDQSLVWINKYGRLESGVKYRIVKESDNTEFYAEFVIN